MTGRVLSEETKEKIRTSMMGKKNNLGYVFTKEHKLKMSAAQKLRWVKTFNNGFKRKSTLKNSIRACPKYSEWRKAVFVRDNYTCVNCSTRGGALNVDHYPITFAEIYKQNNPQNIDDAYKCKDFWDIDNGRTLCIECHKKTPTYGYYKGEI